MIDGDLEVVADLNTAIPGSSGNFTNFGDLAFDRNNVVFTGASGASQGLYTNINNTLKQILVPGETLDGKTIRSLSIGREAISGHQIVFRAVFTDNSQGIYIATLNSASAPESSTMLGVLFTGAVLLFNIKA